MNIGESTPEKFFLFMFFFFSFHFSCVESGSTGTCCAPGVKGLSPLPTLGGSEADNAFPAL